MQKSLLKNIYYFIRAKHVGLKQVFRIPLKDRIELLFLLRELPLNGQAVEVGVQRGIYSEEILKYTNIARLHLVDPWREDLQEVYKDIANVEQSIQERIYQQAKNRMAPYEGRYAIIRKASLEAVRDFNDASCDFIYLDARHSYVDCKNDILAWWPKVAPGGILAGHDYLDGDLPEGVFGVKSAVNEIFGKLQLHVHVTRDPWPSWYVFKPQT